MQTGVATAFRYLHPTEYCAMEMPLINKPYKLFQFFTCVSVAADGENFDRFLEKWPCFDQSVCGCPAVPAGAFDPSQKRRLPKDGTEQGENCHKR